ncbi:YdaE family protein [Klebsiella michiganensis]
MRRRFHGSARMTILIIHGTQLVPRERTYCSKRCGEYDAMANEA